MFFAGVLGGLVGIGVVIGVVLSKTRTDSKDSLPTSFTGQSGEE